MTIDRSLSLRFHTLTQVQRRSAVTKCCDVAASQPDPALWVEDLFSSVRSRLDSCDAIDAVKDAAREHLALIEGDIVRDIASRRHAA